MPVALQVDIELQAPLDVIVVRKLGVPFQPELAMRAVGEDGVRVISTDMVRLAGISREQLTRVENRDLEPSNASVVARWPSQTRRSSPRQGTDADLDSLAEYAAAGLMDELD